MEFLVLGHLEVRREEVSLRLGGPRQRALLARLLVERGAVVSVDRLIDDLWDERPPPAAVNSLQSFVSRLRRVVGSERLVAIPPGYALRLDGATVDADVFERLLASGRAALGAGDARAAAAHVDDALASWRGDPLADIAGERWADVERARLAAIRSAALELRADALLALGRHAELVAELEAAVLRDPLRERSWGQLMRALYAGGRQSDALAAFRRARSLLVDELGLEPGPELVELERAILRHDPVLAAAPPVQAGSPSSPALVEAPASRRLVSVVFFGIAQPDAVDPEDLDAGLQALQELVQANVQGYGGRLDRIAADGLLCVVGASASTGRDAEHATRVAVGVVRAAADAGLDARAGIATGHVLVHPQRGAASGAAARDARHIHDHAGPGEVLVDEATRFAVGERWPAEELAPLGVTGKRAALLLWRLLGLPGRRGIDVDHGSDVPLVGREAELDALATVLARARQQEEARLVTLVGEPGIGKTRLVHELWKRVDARSGLVDWCQGRSLPDGAPFSALTEIVQARAGILASDDRGAAEAKLGRLLDDVLEDVRERAWIERETRPLLGLAVDRDEHGRGTGGDAWRRLVEAAAARRPLVLVLEDLHWADDLLLDWLGRLVEWVSDVPLVVLGTARHELLQRRPQWGGGSTRALAFALGPLEGREASELAAAMLAARGLAVTGAAGLAARAGGVPLYAEEYARLLASRPAAARADTLPETIESVITARLDALDEQAQAVVRAGAVVGPVFWAGAAALLTGLPRTQVETHLRAAERAEIVRRQRSGSVDGDAAYAFRHALVRDVAYDGLLRTVRAEHHRRAAEWLGAASADRPGEHAEARADHYLRALELGRAAGQDTSAFEGHAEEALQDAADRAWRLGAVAAAARFSGALVELAGPTHPRAARLRYQHARAAFWAGQAGSDGIRTSIDALLREESPEAAVEAAMELVQALPVSDGTMAAASEAAQRAVDLLADRPETQLKADALMWRAKCYMYEHAGAETLALGRSALAIADRFGSDAQRRRALHAVGAGRIMVGDAGGVDDIRAAFVLAERLGDGRALWAAHQDLWDTLAAIGRLDEGAAHAASALVLAEEQGDRRRILWSSVERVIGCFIQGRWNEALDGIDHVLHDTAGAIDQHGSLCRVLRASILLGRGDVERAAEDAATALELAQASGYHQQVGPALALRAATLAALGRVEQARPPALEAVAAERPLLTPVSSALAPLLVDHAFTMLDLDLAAELVTATTWMPAYPWTAAARALGEGRADEAARRLREIGYPGGEARAWLRHARLLAAAGRHDAAAQAAGDAARLFRDLEAVGWLADAEAVAAPLPR